MANRYRQNPLVVNDTAVTPMYGRGFFRMKERLGPEQAEALRQEVLKDQIAAREKYGGQAVLPRDRDSYQEYPKGKQKSKRRK